MALSFSCAASLLTHPGNHGKNQQFRGKIQTLVEESGIPSISSSSPPYESLRRGNWVKLICGASFEDVIDIRNLSLVYALAGVDCIDCAADSSVVNAVNEGIEAAREIVPLRKPWVMISINDDEDLHFRKAEFDPEECPADCSRPCEMVCPANAISLKKGGVIKERCYGCGRCFPICPYDNIRGHSYIRDASSTCQLLEQDVVDAIEIHTRARHVDPFYKLWNILAESISHVKLVAVSFPDVGDSTVSAMHMMYSIMKAHLHCYNLWQLDGRPMSGDIGRGATREAIAFALHMAAVSDRPHGFLQLAGGTNSHTIDSLKKVGLFQKMSAAGYSNGRMSAANAAGLPQALIGGVAYGGYARKIVGRVLNKMQSQHGISHIEDYPEYLLEALIEATNLVGPVKCYKLPTHL
ncbi:hypothetical protein AAC387_Pa10g1987 [Persea americana]